jgi:hypothetical protein
MKWLGYSLLGVRTVRGFQVTVVVGVNADAVTNSETPYLKSIAGLS